MSAGPKAGVGFSSIFSTSGGPGEGITAAFMIHFSAYLSLGLTGIRVYPNAGIDRFGVLFYIVERYDRLRILEGCAPSQPCSTKRHF